MRTYCAMTGRQRRSKVAGWILALLGMAGIGLSSGQAQLEFDGGYVQTHREDSVRSWPTPRKKARSSVATPPSYSPDDDVFYPPFNPAMISVTRSYYPGVSSGLPASSSVGKPSFGLSTADFPWNRVHFKDYDESMETIRKSTRFAPQRYFLETTPLRQRLPVGSADSALLIAHLPEHALIWVEGKLTRSVGLTRFFRSPPLRPGQNYRYTVRAAWIENSRWISQSRSIPVHAGLIQTIYLRSKNDFGKDELRP